MVRAPFGFGLGSRTGGSRCAVAGAVPAVRESRTAIIFPTMVAAGAGGLDAKRSIAGAGSIEIIHWTWCVVLAQLRPYQQKG